MRRAGADVGACELADLRHHWGSAYRLSCRRGQWRAVRKDTRETLTAGSAEELREVIRADYRARPVGERAKDLAALDRPGWPPTLAAREKDTNLPPRDHTPSGARLTWARASWRAIEPSKS